MMKLDERSPSNRNVIEHLKNRNGDKAPILPPAAHPYPYTQLGSHPDIVSRIWEELGDLLPTDCRAIVYGTPALVNPGDGAILGLAYGTAYVIKVPPAKVEIALKSGCKVEQKWAGGSTTNVRDLFGEGWLFGGWDEKEGSWVLESYDNR